MRQSFHALDLVLAALADPSRPPAETLAFTVRRAALQARRDLATEPDEIAGFELGFAAALRKE